MNIGIPKEIKPLEGRVALTPMACEALIAKGHSVYLEVNAGYKSGFNDEQYQHIGVTICSNAKQLYKQSQLIVKVKEPVEADLRYLTAEHTLFSFLHLAANPTLAIELSNIGLTAVAFETVSENNTLPLLKPMSQIAGKLAVQVGTQLLHLPQGGSGILLGGLDNTGKGVVLVLGAGSAGSSAAILAASSGADVYVYDQYQPALEAIKQRNAQIQVLDSKQECLALIKDTDLLIGALLVTGKKTPQLVTAADVKQMRKGSVIVDISVDQGGCIETTRATNYEQPTYVFHDVTHFCVTNMPGAVPRTATEALSHLLPEYVHRLAVNQWFDNDTIMRDAVNVKDGKIYF